MAEWELARLREVVIVRVKAGFWRRDPLPWKSKESHALN